MARAAAAEGDLDLWFEGPRPLALAIAGDSERAIVVFWTCTDRDEGVATVDRSAHEGEQRCIVAGGQPGDYPHRSTVPVEAAISAVRYILEHGEPDPALEWESWS